MRQREPVLHVAHEKLNNGVILGFVIGIMERTWKLLQ